MKKTIPIEKLRDAFKKTSLNKRDVDVVLVLCVLAITCLGFLVLSSATLTYGSRPYLIKQGLATILGIAIAFGLMLVDYHIWKKYYPLLYLISVVLLVATLLFGHGDTTWGAKSWLAIGPLNFQPAEFAKIFLVICVASYLDDHAEHLNQPKELLKTLIFACFPVLLILLQPDFGTAMVFLFFIAVMLFFSGLDWKYIFGALGAVLLSLPLFYARLDEYQKDRILDFLKPEANTSGSGYQAYEGRIAIGDGRLFGRGLYRGPQTQYNFIPTKETDFIFPVLVEELGFLGGSLLIVLYGLLAYRLLSLSKIAKDLTGKLMVMGFLSIFFIHIWENVGMTLGLMPITGIPLPFISYGGTFQLVNFAMIGLCLSVRYHRSTTSGTSKKTPFSNYWEKITDRLADFQEEQLHKERKRRMHR
ncbi:MAG: rod shape-determining protein RodA [Peptoniphilus sp.]|nr:rod shape-determining protein RodA [Peptoniphilus sp.]MDD7363609.1 rod shape-determining protein RodA [Bacillota bacterium]MDY6045200.1 rod shape-determining protein RodA [Peptoniphilus sp.]